MRHPVVAARVTVEQVVADAVADGAAAEMNALDGAVVFHHFLRVFDLALPTRLADPEVAAPRVDHRLERVIG